MTQRIGNYNLYFDGQGNMSRHEGAFYSQLNAPMKLTLRFAKKSSSYSGSSYWTMVDETSGRKFPMFSSDIHKLIISSKIDHGLVEEREYIGIKKGNTYGIVPYTG